MVALSPMKVLIYSLHTGPELIGVGKYTDDMARYFAARGVEAAVVSAPPYYPDWRLWPGYVGWRYTVEKSERLNTQRCPIWVPVKPTALKRALHLASFAGSSAPAVLWWAARWRPDVILTVVPTILCAPAASAASRVAQAASWLHVQDLEIDLADGLGLLPASVGAALRRYQAWAFRHQDMVSTISETMAQRIGPCGSTGSRAEVLPNWVDIKAVRPMAESRLRHELGYSARDVVVLYSGNLGEKQGLETLLEAAHRLKADGRLRFVVCGDGARRSRIETEIRDLGLSNVRLLPLQPADRLNDLLNMGDIQILTQRTGTDGSVMPSKLGGMMASGRPVIASVDRDGSVASLLKSSGGGVAVDASDADAFARELRSLADDPSVRSRLGASGREYVVRNWSRDAVLARFYDCALGLISKT